MRCKVLGFRVDRIQGNSVTWEDFFQKCHKVVTKRDGLLILVLMPSKSQTPFGKEVELTCSQQPHISRF